MNLNTFLFLIIPGLLSSCSGQNISHPGEKRTALSAGDTVKELGNNLMLVYQDKSNHYWFGSWENGLYRYDGKTILHFTTKDGLLHNRIEEIKEDESGNIYFNTRGGVNKFDGKYVSALPVSENITNEWKLQNNDLWFRSFQQPGQVYRYDGQYLYSLVFPKHYMADEYFARSPGQPWSPYDVYYIYKDNKGVLWFGTSNFGVCRYDGKSINWLYEEHLTIVPGGGSFGIRSILNDSKGKFWICNTRYRFNMFPDSIKENGKVLVNYQKEKGIDGIKSADGAGTIYFMSITEDSKGNLWMATYNEGVWCYGGKQVTHYPVKDGGKDITVFTIYNDRRGGLWLGTHENGVFKFNGKSFERFKPQP